MIGRSIIIFHFPDGRNEIHSTSPWGWAMARKDADFEEMVKRQARVDKWKAEDTVDDAEVEKIKAATNCIGPDHPGYHEWASDGVTVINVTDEELRMTVKEAGQVADDILQKARKKAMREVRKLAKKHKFKMADVKQAVMDHRKRSPQDGQ